MNRPPACFDSCDYCDDFYNDNFNDKNYKKFINIICMSNVSKINFKRYLKGFDHF